jgi:hypothetical protein
MMHLSTIGIPRTTSQLLCTGTDAHRQTCLVNLPFGASPENENPLKIWLHLFGE